MAKFFGALFIFAAVVFLYKAGVLLPDLAQAFGEFRGSYNPTYVPPDSLMRDYNAYSYEEGLRDGSSPYYYRAPNTPSYAPSYAPSNYYPDNNYGYPNVYASGGSPYICYDGYLPVIDGVNYNPPRLCNQYVPETKFGYPKLPTYQSYAYYPAPYGETPVYEYNPYPVKPSAYYSPAPAPKNSYSYPPKSSNICK